MRKNIKGYGYPINRQNPRFKEFKKQRETRGFDNTELWGLDVAIAKFITPRLKAYIAYKDNGVPQSLINVVGIPGAMFTPYENNHDHDLILDEWKTKLQKMLAYFEFVASEKDTSDRAPVELKEGLELFSKHFSDLWN